MNHAARTIEGTHQEDHDRFLRRFKLKITPSDIEKLDYAYDMAKYGHRNQVRESGARYFEHVRATALILVDELGITDLDIVTAALLHDMLEDNFLLTSSRIKVTFGERVAALVSTITKPAKEDPRFKSNNERHQWYFEQIRNGSPEAKIIKLADRLQNLRTLASCPSEKQIAKIKETNEVYLPLIADVAKEYPKKASYLLTQLEDALASLTNKITSSNQNPGHET
ncbi:hypothetical protein A2686_01505 [Candidatus Woesebacteria bacterium RIFCSPHIGHO2_01_FULL_38_10]|nr:MAG: hypothetical protein A2686_01505 [Candidatus Woesebacteria bacterium RIFCSPHIGHO2_01_FULL_38_10]